MSSRIRSRLIATCFTVTLLAVPAVAFAALSAGSTGLEAAAAGSGLTGGCSSAGCIADVVGRVINVVIGFLGIVLLCLFLYAGFLWMTAGGDEKNVKKAKDILLQAVVGYFIIGMAYALTAFVLDNLAAVTAPAAETAATTPTTPAAR